MATNPDCEICTINKAGQNVIFKSEYWVVTLAKNQDYLGRSYVSLLEHKESLSELSREQWQDFETVVSRIEQGYSIAFDGGRPFNWACMMNDAYKAQAPEPHVHWHVRPRYNKPVSVAGVTFEDPDYAHHYVKSRPQLVEQTVLDAIITAIKQHL